jgi:hypothetical protein
VGVLTRWAFFDIALSCLLVFLHWLLARTPALTKPHHKHMAMPRQ